MGSVHNLLKRRALRIAFEKQLRAPRKAQVISLHDARDLDWNTYIAGPGAARQQLTGPPAIADQSLQTPDAPNDDEEDCDEISNAEHDFD